MPFDIRRLDIYRKVPKDLTQPTLTGAIISVLCCLVIAFLIFMEFYRWIGVELVSSVYVDNPSDSERIPVSITIELPRLACEYVGLDIQDDMGRHEVGFIDSTIKTPINSASGCLFTSKFQINKVPGNFHVSTHSSESQPTKPDFSHVIKEVKFGQEIAVTLPGSFNPLGGVGKEVDFGGKMMGYESHDYIMKIVPTIYKHTSSETISYQYTYAYRSFLRGSTPAIWFRYDLSPLTVSYTHKSTPAYHFVTLLCAVVGGVFTVASILDGIIFSMNEWVRKDGLGKIS